MTMPHKPCPFCDLANGLGQANIVYQTNTICCFLDADPITEGHILIVPKKHLAEFEECDNETLLSLMLGVKVVSKALKNNYHPDGISVMQNGGYFNDIGHLHLHVFPRNKNDGFGWTSASFLEASFDSRAQTSAIIKSKIDDIVSQLEK